MRRTTRPRSGRCLPPPRDGFLRHVVGHLSVPSLDVPVPQMVDQLPDIEHFLRPHSRLILSRLSKCPRSCPSMSLCARPCALRSWWNSWWKFRRQCLTLRYSGLWNSSSTFQFLVVEEQVLVFMFFSQDSVQKRRLPENAFLSGLRSRSLTLFLVEVFLVHLLLTLQLVMKNAQMSLAKGFFALFPKIKKVRRSLRTRGRNCLRTPAHPRRRLSWRTPSSGCGSGRSTLARRTSGTDVLTVQSGVLQRASMLCGTAKRMRWEGFGTGTGDTRVSTFILPSLPPG